MDFCSKMVGLMLLEEIERDSNKNIVVSPFSFSALLNMVAAGSTGPTMKQMLGLLDSTDIKQLNSMFSKIMDIANTTTDGDGDGDRSTNKKRRSEDMTDTKIDNGPIIYFVSGVWVNKIFPLRDCYKKVIETVYKSDARNIDVFKVNEVVEEINAWAKSVSKGLITDIIQPDHIQSFTRLILGNALYFKGSWVKRFDHRRTRDADFYLLDGGKVKVPFMTGCTKYSYGSFENFQVVQIPYRAGEDKKRLFSMYIFLPNERDGLSNLLQMVNSDSEFLVKYSKLPNRMADIFCIPKFKFMYSTAEASEIMKKMGLTLPFDQECQDLGNMVHQPAGEPLYISTIVQKAFIEVGEEGTEATVITRLYLVGGGGPPDNPTEFVADHPFMFMIREENSGVVFFTGAVLNPLLQ